MKGDLVKVGNSVMSKEEWALHKELRAKYEWDLLDYPKKARRRISDLVDQLLQNLQQNVTLEGVKVLDYLAQAYYHELNRRFPGWISRREISRATGLPYDRVKSELRNLAVYDLVDTVFNSPLFTSPRVRISMEGIVAYTLR